MPVRNGPVNPSSNTGQCCLHFTQGMNPTILPPATGK